MAGQLFRKVTFSLERVADKQRNWQWKDVGVFYIYIYIYFFFFFFFFFTFRFTFWALLGTQLINIISKYVFLIIQDLRS